jgi:hypothetical protein
MTKKDLLKALDTGTVRCLIDDELKQFSRKADITGMPKTAVSKADKGATIGVYELGSGELTTITNAEMKNVIGTGLDTADK